jgi:magnesium-transporting ATPase (P-type)
MEGKKMKKKGQTQLSNVTLFFVAIGAILFIGLLMAISGTVVKIVGDQILPDFKELGGSIPQAEEGVNTAINPVQSVIGFIPFLTGVLFLLMLVGSLGLAYAYRVVGEKYLMFMFLGLTVLVVLASIIASNVYEDFYNSGSQIGLELQEQALLSFLMLYSPIIITVIAFIGLAIMFSGMEEVVT